MADEKQSSAPVACSINVSDIITQLHEKAIEATKSKFSDFEIINSAIDGKKGSYKLVSAGEHVITAISKKGTVTRKDAKPVLQTYVQWFVGPDLKSGIDDNSINAMQIGDDKQKAEKSEEKPSSPAETSKDKTAADGEQDAADTETNESIEVMSFSKYLIESKLVTEEGDEPAVDADSAAANDANQRSDAQLNDDTEKADATDTDSDPVAAGWYIAYTLECKGMKQSKIWSSIKSIAGGTLGAAKDVLKSVLGATGSALGSLGITFTSFSGTGSTHTLGGLGNVLKDAAKYGKTKIVNVFKVFRKTDATELKTEFDKKLRAKIPTGAPLTAFYDRTTILSKLKNKNISSQGKAAINKAEYSFCIKVAGDDDAVNSIDEKEIATMLTDSIKTRFRKLKDGVGPKDVIHITLKSDSSTAKESISNNTTTNLLNEESDTDNENTDAKVDAAKQIEEIKKELQEAAKSELGGILVATNVDMSRNISKQLSDSGITDNVPLDLSESEYTFLIQTNEEVSSNAQADQTTVNSSTRCHFGILQNLFETALDTTPNIEKVKKAFTTFVVGFGDKLKGIKLQTKAIKELKAYTVEAETKNESDTLDYAESLFEQLFPDNLNDFIEESRKKKKKKQKTNDKKETSDADQPSNQNDDNTPSTNGKDSDSSTEDSDADNSDNSTSDSTLEVKTQHVFYALPDENGIVKKSIEGNSKKAADKPNGPDHTSHVEWYIVPMKGLKMSDDKSDK